MRRTLGLLALLLAGLAPAIPAWPAAEEAGERLTLARALEAALEANPGVRAAALDVERAEQTVAVTRTRYLPVLSLQAQAGQLLTPIEAEFPRGAFGTLPGVGPVPAERTTVRSSTDLTLSVSSSLTQPLTPLLKTRQSLHLVRTVADEKREQLRAQRAAVVAAVKRAYFGILAGQTALRAAEEQVATERELARMADQLLVREAALEHEALQARGGLAQASLQALTLRHGLESSREQLNRLMGRDVRAAFQVAAVPDEEVEEIGLEAARAQALRDRPEVRQAHQLVAQAEADRGVTKLEWVPDVSLFASYTSYFNTQILPQNVAVAGLQLKWESWDWGRRGHELSEKSLAVEQARLKARDAEQAVLVEVGDQYRKLAEARAGLAVAELNLATLRARAPVIEQRHRVEAALFREVLQARSQLSQAAHDQEQALLTLWTARADFEKALGQVP